MANETNFTGYVEKYVVDEIQRLKAENERLTKENAALKLENNQLDENKTVGLPGLGVTFDISTYDWYIKRENLQEYKDALLNRDFEWLNNHEYSVNGYNWNYEVRIGNDSLRLNIYYNNGNITCSEIRQKYATREEAQKALLLKLNKDITEREASFKKEDEHNAAKAAEKGGE